MGTLPDHCGHRRCGRFVKAGEDFCRAHQAVDWDEVGQRASDALATVRRAADGARESLPHHADPQYAHGYAEGGLIRGGGASSDVVPMFGDNSFVIPAKAVREHGLTSFKWSHDPDEEYEIDRPPVYRDAANELARGKHRKDRPHKRRWYHPLIGKGAR